MSNASPDIERLAAAAGAAANAGRWDEAEQLWREVRARDPNNAQALFSLGVHAMQRRDFAGAASLIEAACAVAPSDLAARLTLAMVRRELGDLAGELQAIDAALAIDPYFLPAMLAKASFYERTGASVMAANFYRYAVKFAPPEPHWPPALRPQLLHARAVSEAHAVAMEGELAAATQSLVSAMPGPAAERWREAASIMAGKTAPYTAQCNQLHVPRLPAIPFFDTAQFAWVPEIEAKTDVIRAELEAALQSAPDQFTPYVAYDAHAPVNQWKELNHSQRWSALQLWRGGQRVEANLTRCPQTAKALEQVEMAEIGGLCPNAMFSALAPHTAIPPHTGETNARVVAHLPLIVPDGCRYRVGFEQRRWEVGKVLVFDDTLEHEAHNDSDELRVVLIFDIWNPYLSPPEREAARVMMDAARAMQSR